MQWQIPITNPGRAIPSTMIPVKCCPRDIQPFGQPTESKCVAIRSGIPGMRKNSEMMKAVTETVRKRRGNLERIVQGMRLPGWERIGGVKNLTRTNSGK